MSGQGSEDDANIGIPMPPFLHKYVEKFFYEEIQIQYNLYNTILRYF